MQRALEVAIRLISQSYTHWEVREYRREDITSVDCFSSKFYSFWMYVLKLRFMSLQWGSLGSPSCLLEANSTALHHGVLWSTRRMSGREILEIHITTYSGTQYIIRNISVHGMESDSLLCLLYKRKYVYEIVMLCVWFYVLRFILLITWPIFRQLGFEYYAITRQQLTVFLKL